MVADLRARGFQLLINGVDWSQYCFEQTVVREEIDLGDGDCRTTAKFRLDVSTIDPLPTYRRDPAQWAKGVPVIFRVRDDSDTLVVPPAFPADLYIFKEPKEPDAGNPIIELECACGLAIKDYSTPDTDDSGVEVGVSTGRNVIVANILTAAGLSADLSSMPYPMDYPVPQTGGTRVQLAGEVAIAAGHFLYIDNSGDVVNKAIDLSPNSAALSITIGQDESEWRPSEASETPLDKLIVSSVTYDVDTLPYQETITKTDGVVADLNPFDPSNTTPVDPITRTTTKIFAYNSATKSRKMEVIQEAVGATLINPIDTSDSRFFELFVSEITTEINYYDGEKLTENRVDVVSNPTLEISRAEMLAGNGAQKSQTRTRYYYNSDNSIRRVLVNKKKRKTDITRYVSERDRLEVVDAEILDSSWENPRGETWVFTQRKSVPFFTVAASLQVRNGSLLDEYFRLSGRPATTTVASNGSVNPPATQYLTENELTERPIESCVSVNTLGSSLFGDRQKSVKISHAVSTDQLYSYGEIYHAFLWGRRFGKRVGLPISDAVLALTPGDRVDVTDGDTIYRLLVDGLTYSFDSTTAFAFFNGIEIGTAPVSDPNNVSVLYEPKVAVTFADSVVLSETFTVELDSGNVVFADQVAITGAFTLTQKTEIEFADSVVLSETFTIELDSGNVVFSDIIVVNSSFRVE